MTAARSQYWITISLLVAVAGTFWLYRYSSNRDLSQSGDTPLPDFYISQPHWTLFDPQGHTDRKMQAKRLEQWPGEEGARLIEPLLHISDQQRRQWLAQARQGRLYPEKASIVLEKQVVLLREDANGGLVLKTSQLQVANKGDTVQTDAPVELRAGSWHFTSNGMRSSLGEQQLELLGRVKGELRSGKSPRRGQDINE